MANAFRNFCKVVGINMLFLALGLKNYTTIDPKAGNCYNFSMLFAITFLTKKVTITLLAKADKKDTRKCKILRNLGIKFNLKYLLKSTPLEGHFFTQPTCRLETGKKLFATQ